jgi:pyridoxamine 5'-phosphate oxidase
MSARMRPVMTAIQDRPFDEGDLEDDPLVLFGRWFSEAHVHGALEPEAVALATASPEGAPSVRMVLMKDFDRRGLSFFTNYGSRKGAELETNPQAALLFHWPELGRQVRIEGGVSPVNRRESEAYAKSRSRPSQLSALASPQSRPVPNREWLERRVADLASEHGGARLPVSEDWGGYRLVPRAWEFWQHRPNRLHDRFRYELGHDGWSVERLAP